MIKFLDWVKLNEDSPTDRWRTGWGRSGSYPLQADVMSRSTPPPDIMKKAEKALGTPEHPKKKHKKRKK